MKNKLILLSILIALLIVGGVFFWLARTGKINPGAAGGAATLTLSPSSGSYSVSQTFKVNITLNTGGAAVDGVDIFHLRFDPKVLQVQDANGSASGTQIQPGTIFPTYNYNSTDNSTGSITMSGLDVGGQGYSGTGVFAIITFKAIAKSSGTAVNFDFTPGSATDCNVVQHGTATDILSAVTNGTYVITGQPQSGPSVDIKANSQDGPITIDSGSSTNLSWTTSNASTCTASGDWSGNKGTSGSQSTGNLNSSKTYTLTCQGNGGSASDSVTISISSPGGGSSNPGDSTPQSSSTSAQTTPTPTPSSGKISNLPSAIQPKTTPTPSQTTLYSNTTIMKPWILWFLYAIIPAFLAGAAIFLYLRRKRASKNDNVI